MLSLREDWSCAGCVLWEGEGDSQESRATLICTTGAGAGGVQVVRTVLPGDNEQRLAIQHDGRCRWSFSDSGG